MDEFINNNLFSIITTSVTVVSLVVWIKFKIEDIDKRLSDTSNCDKHSTSIGKLKQESIQNQVFQAQILAKLEALNNKIEIMINPLQQSVDDIKKKLNIL
jgi:hypothetical protein